MSVKIHAHTNKNSKLMTTKTYGALHFKRNVYLFIHTREEATKALAEQQRQQIWSIIWMGYESILSFRLFFLISHRFTSLVRLYVRNDTWIFNECVNQSKLERTHTLLLLLCATSFFWLHFILFIVAAAIFCMIEEQQQDYFCTVRFYCVCLCLLTFLNCSLCQDASF